MKKILFSIFVLFFVESVIFAQEADSEDPELPNQAWSDHIRSEAEAAIYGSPEEDEASESDPAYNDEAPEEEPSDLSPKTDEKKKRGLVFPYRRYIEFGLDVDVGFSNNFIGVLDILKENIVVDMSKLTDKIKTEGWMLNFGLDTTLFFLNINVVPLWGIDLFAGLSGNINATIPRSLLSLLSKGNIKQYSNSGDISAWGSIFVDTGADIHVRPKLPVIEDRLKISIIPSMFVPIVYIPKSSFRYSLSTTDSMVLTADGDIPVYMPVYDPTNTSGLLSQLNGLLDQSGFDLGLRGEYALLKGKAGTLDVGGGLSNIPIVPAVLTKEARATLAKTTIFDGSGLLTGDMDNVVTTPELEITYANNVRHSVVRPMTFDIFATYKPFGINPITKDMVLIRPIIGFTVLTPDDEFYFNVNLEAQLKLPVLLIGAATGYNEGLWKHTLNVGLNLRLLEIDVGVYLSSQDFVESFDMDGAGVKVGLKMGF